MYELVGLAVERMLLTSSSVLKRMTHKRPALFAVDIRLDGGGRNGQRWNKRDSDPGVSHLIPGGEAVGNYHHPN